MKLRDRTKRVLGNIKQEEDHKSVLAIMAESNTVATTDTFTDDPTVKEEDTKEEKLLLKRNGDFGKKGYCYRCDRCEVEMTDLKSVLEHRRSIHYVKKVKKKIKHLSIEPDIHNPSFYCKSCEIRYKDMYAYRRHLRNVHYMVFKRIPIWKAPHNNILPDLNDPDLYCRAFHKVESSPPQQMRSDILPDVNDPNFYCRSCEKKMANKCTFRRHLMLVHSIFQAAPHKKSRLNPDVNNPNNHCRAYDTITTERQRQSYRPARSIRP
ncbi:hypothetical protein MBANPS3_005902 [Mucor bainieri]